MTPVFVIRHPTTGAVIMDLSSAGGVYLGRLTMAPSNSGSIVYNADPKLAGRTALAIQLGDGSHNWSAGSSGGYPAVSWTGYEPNGGSPTATVLAVFAR